MTPQVIVPPAGSEPALALRGRVVTPDGVIEDGVVIVTGAVLGFVGDAEGARAAGFGAELDAAARPADGTLLIPGLIDLHCHGGGGASFPDALDSGDAQAAIDSHRRAGTTTLVASLVTAAPQTLRTRVGLLAELADSGELDGIHIEGPFLSLARCGAQDPGLIQSPDADLVRELAALARGHLVTMTIAAELAGNIGSGGVCAALIASGALPSFGHTDAADGQTRAGIQEAHALLAAPGARSARPTVTHLFNGMRPVHHREAGPIPDALAAAARGQAVVELVADGTHLSPHLVREVFELVGPRNIALVTDAMAAAGMPDGEFRLGSLEVEVLDGVARLAHGGAIAGGTAHLSDVVRTSVLGGVPLVDAVRSASTTPASVLGRSDVGALETGRRADVVILDANLGVSRVLRAGREVR